MHAYRTMYTHLRTHLLWHMYVEQGQLPKNTTHDATPEFWNASNVWATKERRNIAVSSCLRSCDSMLPTLEVRAGPSCGT